MSNNGITRIVIVGGGFAGMNTARRLERLWRFSAEMSITLISQQNYFLMTPLLFEAGSGVLEPRHAVTPIRKMFSRVHFIEADVQGIDLNANAVAARLARGEVKQIAFDHLVIAVGGVTNTKMIEGSRNARTFKTLADAITLRNHIIQTFEQADVESDPGHKKALLTYVIVGGGLVGVELQGELTEFLENARTSYRNVAANEIRFELIEAGKRLLPEMEDELAEYATATLKGRGVNVRNDTRVDRIAPEKVHLDGGETIESQTIILAGGVMPSPLIGTIDVEKDKHGRIVVEPTMQCKSHPQLWALGDCASIPDPQGHPYPMLAQHALREAKALAKNITSAVRGHKLKPFVYKTKGTLASLGRRRGAGRVYIFKVRGFAAWWVWRTYYLMQMPRWERRVRIVIDWTIALFFKNDIVQLDMRPEAPESQPAPGTAAPAQESDVEQAK